MSFTSEKDTVKKILNSHKVGEFTTEEETLIISAFFRAFHPDWYDKTLGMKVIKYSIEPETTYRRNGRCFFLIREDGEKEDIGYGKLSAKLQDVGKIKFNNIASACRYAIEEPCIKPKRDAVVKALNEGVEVKSNLSGKNITFKTGFQIDHYNENFETLVQKWIDLKGIDYLFSKINMGEHNSTITRFIDDKINEEFVDFHNKHTHLRVVTREENLSLLRKTK